MAWLAGVIIFILIPIYFHMSSPITNKKVQYAWNIHILFKNIIRLFLMMSNENFNLIVNSEGNCSCRKLAIMYIIFLRQNSYFQQKIQRKQFTNWLVCLFFSFRVNNYVHSMKWTITFLSSFVCHHKYVQSYPVYVHLYH